MKIRCILEREGGSLIDIGDKKYHFKPNEQGHHVADVNDKSHLARFLQIPEAYELYGVEPETVQPDAATPPVPAIAGNGQPQGDSTDLGDGEQSPAADSEPKAYDAMERADLLKLAEERAGKRLHPNLGKDKIIALLKDLGEK